MEYTYKGTRISAQPFIGKQFNAVRNEKGKCVVGKNGSMLVVDEDGVRQVIVARRLVKNKPFEPISREVAADILKAHFGPGEIPPGEFAICYGQYVDWDSFEYDEFFLIGKSQGTDMALALKRAPDAPKPQKKPRRRKNTDGAEG